MTKFRFIISVFGDRHVGMLLPLLFSIEQSCPDADASIYWEDISEQTKRTLRNGFQKFHFTETDFRFSCDITRRISSKTVVWEYAAHREKSTADWLIFIDADTLILRNPLPILEKIHADIIFTQRNESPFWINTGVVAAKNTEKIPGFFTKWREETEIILNTPKLFAEANDKNFPYGGADQMSFQRLIGYSRERDTFRYRDLILKSIHCQFLNETYSCPVTEDTHIIHYKGGWRDILFFGGTFTKNRPKKNSWEMYVLYIRTFQNAVSVINQRLRIRHTVRDFGFSIPFYIDSKTLKERSFLYAPFFALSWIRRLPRRASAYIKDRL